MQFKTPEGISILKTCDTWAAFILSHTVLVDLLGICLDAKTPRELGTSDGEAIGRERGAVQGPAGLEAHGHSSDGPVSVRAL